MLLRFWQWLEKSLIYQSFLTLCMIVNTNRFSRHLVRGNLIYLLYPLSIIIRCLLSVGAMDCLLGSSILCDKIQYDLYSLDLQKLVQYVCLILCSILDYFSWPCGANKIGPLSASTLPVLHEGSQDCSLFSIFGIL